MFRSSIEAEAERTRRPVSIATSSIVSTFVGSAIASSSVPSSKKADRHRLVATDRLHVDQVHRAHVQLVNRQIYVFQAEALRHHTRQLVVAQDALLDEDLTGGLALSASDLHSLLDLLARGEAKIYDHVADQTTGTAVGERLHQRVALDRAAASRLGRSHGRTQQRELAHGCTS